MPVSDRQVLDHAKKWVPRSIQPSLNSNITSDLGIDGDSFEEFINEFASEYNLELPAIDWQQHYHGESELSSTLFYPKLLVYKLGLSARHPLRTLIPFTLSDLKRLSGSIS